MSKKAKEKKYSINWTALSNDMLLELWIFQRLDGEELEVIEKILKDRFVIRE